MSNKNGYNFTYWALTLTLAIAAAVIATMINHRFRLDKYPDPPDKNAKVDSTVISEPDHGPSDSKLGGTTRSPLTNVTKDQSPQTPRQSPVNGEQPATVTPTFIDYINHSTTASDIAIVIESDGEINSQIASRIGKLYESKGYPTTTSQFTQEFVSSAAFKEVEHAQAKTIEKLGLPTSLKYIVIGTYSNEIEDGKNSGGYTKFVSRAKLKISIVSCEKKSQMDSFLINVNNGYFDKESAQDGAIDKIIDYYKENHLNLN